MTARGERLAGGLEVLKAHRDGKAGWRRFPFHYTLLALSEMDGAGALAELRHAAPRLERMLKRSPGDGRFDLRRRAVAERVLARIQ